MSDQIFKNTSNSVPFNYSHVTLQVPKPQLLKPQASRGVYTCHANGTSQELCGKDVGTTTCSISLCLVILSGPWDSPGFNKDIVGKFTDAKELCIVQARGWCWAHARDILQVHMVSGSKQHMTTLRPVHTAVFSVRQWQLKCHAWREMCFGDEATISVLMSHAASMVHITRCWGMHEHSPCSL